MGNDGQEKRNAELILKMKEIKEDNQLSIQNIVDMVIADGGNTSRSSVQRVFADGSENQNFRFQETLLPIANALLAMEKEKALELDNVPELKSAAEIKDELIEELKAENEALSAELATVREEMQKKVDYLKWDARRKNKIIAALFVLAVLMLCFIVAVVVYDRANPDIGWFREIASRYAGSTPGEIMMRFE